MGYRSLLRQTLHYFARPHEGPRLQPLDVPAAWRGADLAVHPERWTYTLSAAESEELRRAVRHARSTGKPTGKLRREDLPLPTLAPRIAHWREELARGRGLQLVRGVPVDEWSTEDAERFFWCFGLHMGIPGAQNPQGELLGHVRDEGVDYDSGIRAYRTRRPIAYHCDAADVVGLLCLTKARRGGLSRIASTVTVYNELLRRRPELAPRLYRPFSLDTRSDGGGLEHFPVPPCRFAEGELRTFYHSDYFRSATRHADALPLTDTDRELLDLYEEIAASPEIRLEMDLAPGDIQLLSNHTQMHARTGYEDAAGSEGSAAGRHLLRLWLSLPHPRSLRHRYLTLRSRIGLVATLARERARQGGIVPGARSARAG